MKTRGNLKYFVNDCSPKKNIDHLLLHLILITSLLATTNSILCNYLIEVQFSWSSLFITLLISPLHITFLSSFGFQAHVLIQNA